MKTLHILRKRKDTLGEAAICSEAASSSTSGGSGGEANHRVTVLLIQDAVLGSPTVPVPVYVSLQDLQARGVTRNYNTVSYEQICQMILDHDRTIVW
jgi:hypothetical protein